VIAEQKPTTSRRRKLADSVPCPINMRYGAALPLTASATARTSAIGSVNAAMPAAPSLATAASGAHLARGGMAGGNATNSGLGNGSAATHASNASMRSASEREARTVWNTIARTFGRCAITRAMRQPLGHGLVGCAAEVVHKARGGEPVVGEQDPSSSCRDRRRLSPRRHRRRSRRVEKPSLTRRAARAESSRAPQGRGSPGTPRGRG